SLHDKSTHRLVHVLGHNHIKYIGLNYTQPHKLLALPMVDLLVSAASQCVAVNTVRFEVRTATTEWRSIASLGESVPDDIRSHGFNTDADAIIRSLQEALSLNVAGKKILLLGAGGAGRVAALKLASEKAAELYLVNRTASKAEAVADEISKRYPECRAVIGYPKGAVDILLNATSLGLKPDDPLPFQADQFSLRAAAA